MNLAPIYVVLAIGVIVFTVRKLLRAGVRLDNLKADATVVLDGMRRHAARFLRAAV